MKFLLEYKSIILPFAGLILSEFLSLHPKYKSNGLIQLISNILNRKK